jgi:lysophospholipase L1-like esterase
MTPSLQGHLTQGLRDGHAFLLDTNADGLRTRVERERSPGLRRVAVAGDSTVFGWGVDEGGTVADGLQAALGPDFEVINAGQPGYSSVQAAWLVEEVLLAYQPDLVILFIPMHDFNRVLVSDRELLRGAASPTAWARVALARHSRIYSVLRKAIFDVADQPFLLPERTDGEPRVERVSDRERAEAFREARAALRAQGGELAIGFLPFQAELEGPGPDERRPGLDWARDFAAEDGVGLVDLRACCRGSGRVLPDDSGHLSREGNLAVGAAAAPVVRELLSGAGASGPAGAPR